MTRRIALSELHRIKKALKRFEAKIDEAYPGYLIGEGREKNASQDMSETVRNAMTALAHVSGWIDVRQRIGRDPFEEGTGE